MAKLKNSAPRWVLGLHLLWPGLPTATFPQGIWRHAITNLVPTLTSVGQGSCASARSWFVGWWLPWRKLGDFSCFDWHRHTFTVKKICFCSSSFFFSPLSKHTHIIFTSQVALWAHPCMFLQCYRSSSLAQPLPAICALVGSRKPQVSPKIFMKHEINPCKQPTQPTEVTSS